MNAPPRSSCHALGEGLFQRGHRHPAILPRPRPTPPGMMAGRDSPVVHASPLVRGQRGRPVGAAVGSPALRAEGGRERAVAGAALPAPGHLGRAAVAAGARGDQPRGAGGRADGTARVDAARRLAQPVRARLDGRGAGPRARTAAGRPAGGGVHRGALARAAGAAGARFHPARRSRAGRFYQALGDAEERHAEIFLELARPLVPADAFDERLDFFGQREAEILGALPHAARIH